MDEIKSLAREFGIFIVIGVVGLGVLGYGLWGEIRTEKATVEIVKNQDLGSSERSGEVVVDLAGAIEKPGVYKLPSGSRIGDVLVMGGGLSASADREWVAKTINLAEEVKDGEKIYVPARSDSRTADAGGPSKQLVGKVNINTASMAEIDSLEGVGEVRAKLILDSRPYSRIYDLVSKAKIPESVYEKIKDKISVY